MNSFVVYNKGAKIQNSRFFCIFAVISSEQFPYGDVRGKQVRILCSTRCCKSPATAVKQATVVFNGKAEGERDKPENLLERT